MEKVYKKVDMSCGTSLENVIYKLWDYQKQGEFVSTEFNGHQLYSDKVSLDGTYLEVVGKTFFEFEEANRIRHEKYEKDEREFQITVPSLILEWEEDGHKVLNERYWKHWDEIVPFRVKDLYHGMELGNCLEIVGKLNNGCSLEDAKDTIGKQDHSGMSYSLVRNMVGQFCDRGNEFFEYTKM